MKAASYQARLAAFAASPRQQALALARAKNVADQADPAGLRPQHPFDGVAQLAKEGTDASFQGTIGLVVSDAERERLAKGLPIYVLLGFIPNGIRKVEGFAYPDPNGMLTIHGTKVSLFPIEDEFDQRYANWLWHKYGNQERKRIRKNALRKRY